MNINHDNIKFNTVFGKTFFFRVKLKKIELNDISTLLRNFNKDTG